MPWNSRMRRRTDLNKSSRSKSTEPEILLRSSSTTPEGAGEEKLRNPELRSARTPEPSPEGPGRGEQARPDAERAHQEWPPAAPKWLAGKRQRTSPPPPPPPRPKRRRRQKHWLKEQSEQGKGTDHCHTFHPSGTSPYQSTAHGAALGWKTPEHTHIDRAKRSQRLHKQKSIHRERVPKASKQQRLLLAPAW